VVGLEIRDASLDDAEAWCALVNAVWPHNPRSPVRYRHMRTVVDPLARHVLGERDGRAVAAAVALRPPWTGDPELINGGVWVLPSARGQGVGTALLAHVERLARERGARRLGVGVCGDDADSRRFVDRRGFVVSDVVRRVGLRVADAPRRTPSFPTGVRLTTLAAEPELLRPLYELDMLTQADIPSSDPPPQMSFEAWCAAFTDAPGFRPDALFMAVREGRPIGYAALDIDDVRPAVADHAMTAVHPDERGHGIATALKLATIEWAREAGIEELETSNHEQNAAMRAVNARLGYTPRPDQVFLRHDLEPAVPTP
jgi:GNAT superfamily N-acetyltransferase